MDYAIWSWKVDSNWFVPYSTEVSTSLEFALAIKNDIVRAFYFHFVRT